MKKVLVTWDSGVVQEFEVMEFELASFLKMTNSLAGVEDIKVVRV